MFMATNTDEISQVDAVWKSSPVNATIYRFCARVRIRLKKPLFLLLSLPPRRLFQLLGNNLDSTPNLPGGFRSAPSSA